MLLTLNMTRQHCTSDPCIPGTYTNQSIETTQQPSPKFFDLILTIRFYIQVVRKRRASKTRFSRNPDCESNCKNMGLNVGNAAIDMETHTKKDHGSRVRRSDDYRARAARLALHLTR